MKTTFSGVAALALVLAMGGAAAAQAPATSAQTAPRHARAAEPISQTDFVQRRVERLRAADANGDGQVTAEEMRAHGQARRAERRAAQFDRLDADKDGALSRAEFETPRVRGDRTGEARHDGARMTRGHGGKDGRGWAGRNRGGRGMAARAEARFPLDIAEVERKANEAFARMDANGDGVLSVEERRAAMQAGRAEMRQKREQRRATPASPSAPASE